MKPYLLTAVAVGEAVPVAPAKARSETLWAQTSRRLKRSHTAVFGLVVVIALILVATFADVLAPYSPTDTNPNTMFQMPNSEHWLGTDQLGRDMLSRVIYGSRVSLTVGLSSVVVAVFIGVARGLVGGVEGCV
jgi:ABC-type dipeptide/oligopeptide/nickel transport system permease subunit